MEGDEREDGGWSVLEHGAVAFDDQGWRAGSQALCQRAPGGPGAAFEHAGQRHLLGARAQQAAQSQIPADQKLS